MLCIECLQRDENGVDTNEDSVRVKHVDSAVAYGEQKASANANEEQEIIGMQECMCLYVCNLVEGGLEYK